MRPWLFLPIAIDRAAERRPQVISISGQGGASSLLLGSRLLKGAGLRWAGIQLDHFFNATVFSVTTAWVVFAIACARPVTWLRMPAAPLVMVQIVSGP